MLASAPIEGYLISVKGRGAASSLVQILTADGLFQTTCPRGMGGRKSFPLAAVTGALCRFEGSRKSDSHPYSIESYSVLEPSPLTGKNLAANLAFMTAAELVVKVFDACPLLEGYRRFVSEVAQGQIWAGLLDLLVEGINLSGIRPSTRSCASCGRKEDLVAFDFASGGFLCRECCLDPEAHVTGRKNLLSYRYIFETPLNERETPRLEHGFLRRAVQDSLAYLESYFGIRIETLETLAKLYK